MHIEVKRENMYLLEAFASETRVAIIEWLNTRPMNIRELAAQLHLSSAIVTRHVQKLERAGLLRCEQQPGLRGMQKVCSLAEETLTLQLRTIRHNPDVYVHEIPVGQYNAYDIRPTCGLCSAKSAIGMHDDIRYFADPLHTQAELLWFGSGWIAYRIPNYLLASQTVRSLEISLELCSEAPGFNENRPSDIGFRLNGQLVGVWTSPGDFGSRPGVHTPNWWRGGTQHGVLKTLRVDATGSHVDGVLVSDVALSALGIVSGSEITFQIENLESARHAGGVNLFGSRFGNYAQGIRVAMGY